MAKGGRLGWRIRLHTLKIGYNYDKRRPPKEEPKCVLAEAAQSHIIVN